MLKMMYWIIYNDQQFNNCTRLDDKGSAPDFSDVSRTVTNFFLYQEKKNGWQSSNYGSICVLILTLDSK